jgi:hypothetical protein
MLQCLALRIDGPRWRADDRRAGRVFDGLVFEGPLVVYATPSEYKTAMRGVAAAAVVVVSGW